jgi:2-desacetyl-2-hydroxyethyl bacteriochlorophyllide A dehydrogenase
MSTNLVKGAVVRGPGRVESGDVEIAEPSADEVLLKIEACGICGSDLHMLAGDGVPVGLTPGHEICGRIERIGKNVKDFGEGTRVVVEPTASCGRCRYCNAGDPQLCAELSIYGVHRNGGFAEKMIVRADCLHRVDDALTPQVASLAEPLAVAVHGMRRAGLEPGNRILVQGAGTIGLVTTLVARAMGAEVWQSARYQHQAQHASQMGATRVLREEEADALALAKLARRTDFDIVAETVGGHANTLEEACYAVRPGGTILILGMFVESPTLAPLSLLVKEATLVWSNCYARHEPGSDFAEAVRILEDERELAATLATHQFGMDDIAAAFAAAADRRSGAIKVAIVA